MATWLAGCQSASNDSHNSVDDALASYNELFMAIKSKKAVGVEELISLVQEWRKLEATVSATMERDTAAHADTRHISLGDSIKIQMSRLIDNQTWDYSDYLAVVRELNEVEMDSVSQKLVASVHLFYHNAGTTAQQRARHVIRAVTGRLRIAADFAGQFFRDALAVIQRIADCHRRDVEFSGDFTDIHYLNL